MHRRSKLKYKEEKERLEPVNRKRAIARLEAWFKKNEDDPYPKGDDMEELMEKTGFSSEQVSTWLNRRRKKNSLKDPRPTEDQKRVIERWREKHPDVTHPTAFQCRKMAEKSGMSEQQVRWNFERWRSL